MKTPFTTEEIEKASKIMKNQKSVGEDGLNAEYVKYGPPEIHNGIATLLNTIARTGKYPAEIKSGILTPLPKPGKKQGPPANLRPIGSVRSGYPIEGAAALGFRHAFFAVHRA